ncbi:MAG: MBL fold metallo-hydrolase [Chloroflexota bacterium]|nr:MBL fold metallo-hydrolase [Chloroflexota bacterium]
MPENTTPTPVLVPDRPHPVRLLPGLYQVGGGYLSHSRDAASYLIRDETSGEGILVDCGSHCGAEAVLSNLQQVTDTKLIRLIIGTHGHWDHVEGVTHLREVGIDAPFVIHELDAEHVRTGDPDLTCAGFLYNEHFHVFEPDALLQGGEHYQLGDFDMEVMHLPGHTLGCIGIKMLYARTGQVILLPGDSIQGGFSTRIRSDLNQWRQSVRRLMSERIDLLLPNHLPPGSQTSLLADLPNRLARVYSQLETDFYSFSDHQRTL